ncbi:MAG: proton-conducting transporter membrane subunit, partial [Candidatus Omnitrophica bacterium]|nr:proton-conducting transporter membrane subunit [Candidatus Omnitrophota bacterium]
AVIMFSGLVAAVSALRENNIKRILAYSTISQLSYIFLGLIINSALAFGAALLYILVHSVGKAGLFLTAGIVEQKTHTKNLNQLGGLMKSIPLAAVSFLLCAFSIIGIPPFGGFFSKFYVILATARAGHTALAALGIITAFVTLLYLIRLFDGIFLGEVKTPLKGKVPMTMTSVVLTCGIISLLIGLFVRYPLNFINSIIIALGR